MASTTTAGPALTIATAPATVPDLDPDLTIGTVPVEEFEETVFTIGTVPVTPGP